MNVAIILSDEYNVSFKQCSAIGGIPVVFFKSRDGSDYLKQMMYRSWDHADGMYGWYDLLHKCEIFSIRLHSRHVTVFTHEASLLQLASAVTALCQNDTVSLGLPARHKCFALANPI